MEHGKPGVTGRAAPSPVVEELKKDTESASQFQPIARENHMSPGSVTSTNVIYVIFHDRFSHSDNLSCSNFKS